MSDATIDLIEDAILNDEVSDESLEAAALVGNSAAWSVGFFCTGLSECPA